MNRILKIRSAQIGSFYPCNPWLEITVYFDPLGFSSLRKTTSSFNRQLDGVEFHLQVCICKASGSIGSPDASDG